MRFSKAVTFLSLFVNGVLVGAIGMQAYAAMRGSAVFTDIPQGAYYDQHVGDLYGAGIVKGKSPGKYAPTELVSRADVAVMLGRLRNEIKGLPLDPTTSTTSSSSRSSRSSSSSSVSSSSSSVAVGAGVFQFGLESFSIVRSAPRALLSINRVNGSKGSVSIRYKTVDGSAKADVHYAAMDGKVTFNEGETTQTITIPLKNTAPNGYNTDFTIELFEPVGATLGTPKVLKVTLLDQGPNPSSSSSSSGGSSSSSSSTSSSANDTFEFSASLFSFSERAGNVTITVRRNGSTSNAASVNYATSNMTAEAGANYISTSGTLNFASGETTKTFTVSLINKTSIDGNKNVRLTLSAPSAGTSLGVQNPATLTILDEDATPISGSGIIVLAATNFNAEKGKIAYVTVQRNGNPTATATVQYATSDRTAFTNADYTPSNGTLTFLPGETSKNIPITILSGAKSERQLNLTISNPTQATLGLDYTATVTIQ